jgi:hypothetical protein
MNYMKKAEVNFLLVSIIIALLLLFSYIIISSDIISKVFGTTNEIIEDEITLKIHCITNDPLLDKNGDGFRDEDYDKGDKKYLCSQLKKSD